MNEPGRWTVRPALPPFLRRRPRTAFVLGGGGNLGAVQVGMLRALVEHDIVPDVVLGCSVGAVNGAAFAANPTAAGVAHLEDVWMRVEEYEIMPPSRLPTVVHAARRGPSLHDNDGLRRMVEEGLPVDRIEDLAVPFQCVATSVESATERWFTEGPVVEAVLASAALPIVYPPVEIGGHRYIDGGVLNDVPVSRAVEVGVDRIFVLSVGNLERTFDEPKRPIDVGLTAFWIARQHRYREDLAALPRNIEVTILPSGGFPGKIKFDDFSKSDELLHGAYLASSARLDAAADLEAAQRARPQAAMAAQRLVRPSGEGFRKMLERS